LQEANNGKGTNVCLSKQMTPDTKKKKKKKKKIRQDKARSGCYGLLTGADYGCPLRSSTST
jgi:hypothetical protein